MDIANLLAVPADHDQHNVTSLQEENDRLRRLLATTARSYNALKKDLDIAREELGHNRSPMPFLELPREVRDQIYLYALGTPHVNTEPRPIAWLAFEYCQTKPASPNLCLANKQAYRESVEVLYSENAFRFERPSHLLQFEEQIGSSNRDLIRSIQIATANHLPQNSSMIDSRLIASCDYQPIPTHWAKALSKSKLKSVTEMFVVNYPSMNKDAPIEVMAECLGKAIEAVFGRNIDPLLIPCLTLEGFGEKEWEKFPLNWKINTVGVVLEPEVADSGTFASAALSSNHFNFGFLPGQDKDADSGSSEE